MVSFIGLQGEWRGSGKSSHSGCMLLVKIPHGADLRKIRAGWVQLRSSNGLRTDSMVDRATWV